MTHREISGPAWIDVALEHLCNTKTPPTVKMVPKWSEIFPNWILKVSVRLKEGEALKRENVLKQKFNKVKQLMRSWAQATSVYSFHKFNVPAPLFSGLKVSSAFLALTSSAVAVESTDCHRRPNQLLWPALRSPGTRFYIGGILTLKHCHSLHVFLMDHI